MPNGSPADKPLETVADAEIDALINGLNQQFFFLVLDESDGSMTAPFKMEEMGFACPF